MCISETAVQTNTRKGSSSQSLPVPTKTNIDPFPLCLLCEELLKYIQKVSIKYELFQLIKKL